jgi:hypothetical protein
MRKAADEKLISFFEKKNSFSRQDLYNYFLQTEGEIKEGTLSWRIYDLKKKNMLNEVRKGYYTTKTKPVYVPTTDAYLIKLAAFIQKNYRFARYCLTDVNWLNEFTIHQFNQQMVITEIEKDLEESLAHNLADNGYNILRDLRGSLMKAYQKMVISFPLISRAPIQRIIDGRTVVMVPTIEKIMVDIYQDQKIYHFIQGEEMIRIFENVINRYSINYSTLFTYAKRRGKEDELRTFINENFPGILI